MFQAATALSLGAVATHYSLSRAIEIGAIGIAVVGTTSMVLALSTNRAHQMSAPSRIDAHPVRHASR